MPAQSSKNRFSFNKTKLQGIRPSGKRETYHDTHIDANGLKLRVTPAGTKTFALIRKNRTTGKTLFVTLGAFPDMTVEQAREHARTQMDLIVDGKDPNAARRAETNRQKTLRHCFADYMQSRPQLRDRTVKGYERILQQYADDWLDKLLLEITRDMVEKRHQVVGKASPTRANTLMRVIRALFNYAQGKYEDEDYKPIVLHNPVARLSYSKAWFKESRRDTYIKPTSLKSWYDAVTSIPEWMDTLAPETMRDYYLVLLFTGLRRDEALTLRWEWVDLNESTLKIPLAFTKNGYEHQLPLSDFLHDLLSLRHTCEQDYVFPGIKTDSHLTDPVKPTRKIRSRSGVFFSPHTLRRTFITTAESLGIRDYTLKRLLNHRKKADVTDGYIVTDVERLREPMQQITDRLLLRITQPDNVVPIKKIE